MLVISIALASATLLFTGCALPKHAVVLMAAPPDRELKQGLSALPPAWDGRLLEVGEGAPEIGGEPTHRHSFAHVHSTFSQAADLAATPLGISAQGAKQTHTHHLISVAQTPTLTGEVSNIPESHIVYAAVLHKSFLHMHPGVIVAMESGPVPAGWLACDGTNSTPQMSGLYLMVRNTEPASATTPRPETRHDATHQHTWAVAATDPTVGANVNYAGTQPVPAHHDLTVSPLEHTHTAIETAPWNGLTDPDATPPLPPSVAVRFIMAGPHARKMPKGALIPFSGDTVPASWSEWRVINGKPVAGHFLFGESIDHPLGSEFGTESHTHTVTMTHIVTLTSSPEAGIPDLTTTANPSLAMALIGHTHTATTSGPDGTGDRIETGPASHIPPYLKLRFIQKN
ncbi:MAG: hypothetical protein WAN35_12840 [Terracidiphilus sp.]